MGDQGGQIISTRTRVDHVTSDHYLLWYLLSVKCVRVRMCACVCSPVYLSLVEEIWIVISGIVHVDEINKLL